MTFPYRHDDLQLKDLTETPHNERVTIEGRVESEPSVLFLGKNRSRLQVRLLAGRHLVKAVFFNQHYLKDRFRTWNDCNGYREMGPWQAIDQCVVISKLVPKRNRQTLNLFIA